MLKVSRILVSSVEVVFHATPREAADQLLREQKPDLAKYQSGFYHGFYTWISLEQARSYADSNSRKNVVLALGIQGAQLISLQEAHALVDPKEGRYMSEGYKANLAVKAALQAGYDGLVDGNCVILINPACVRSIQEV